MPSETTTIQKSLRFTAGEWREISDEMEYLGMRSFTDFVRVAIKDKIRANRRERNGSNIPEDELDAIVEEKMRKYQSTLARLRGDVPAAYRGGQTQEPFVNEADPPRKASNE